jgi:YqjK-like protein
MSNKRTRLVERREYLVAQAALQRRMLTQDIERWRAPLALADQALNRLRYIRRHPQWIFGGIALLAILRPRRAGKWLGRGWVTWQLMHRLRGGSAGVVRSPTLASPISTVAH